MKFNLKSLCLCYILLWYWSFFFHAATASIWYVKLFDSRLSSSEWSHQTCKLRKNNLSKESPCITWKLLGDDIHKRGEKLIYGMWKKEVHSSQIANISWSQSTMFFFINSLCILRILTREEEDSATAVMPSS